MHLSCPWLFGSWNLKMPKAPWIQDDSIVTIPTTVSRLKAFRKLIAHDYIPYNDVGLDFHKFIDDVDDVLKRLENPNQPEKQELNFGVRKD